jgi:nucleotide-binding universal stress UspA family protein
MKRLRCPLIVVPSGYSYEKPKEIIFPTDYEVTYDCLPLQALVDIAANHESRIEVVHVSSGYELTEAQVNNRANLKGMLAGISHFFHDLPSQEIITAINSFQAKTDVNFLVMVKNKHTFLERLFIEPVIKKIAFHVTIPFMIVPCQ